MTTLVLADVVSGDVASGSTAKLGDVTAKALTAALALGAPVHVLVAGLGVAGAAAQAAALDGVETVLTADSEAYGHALAEPLAALLVALAPSYGAIVAASTAASKNVMPRVAALLDVMQVSDISKVVSADTFERPIYAGNAIQTVRSSDAIKVITVRTATFAATGAGATPAPIEAVSQAPSDPGVSTFASEAIAANERPDLTGAKIVVSGGRAVANAENFQSLIVPLADSLHAAVGASRAAVDAGYAPNDWQVGQTGKIVAPELYVAVGISGAIQHLAGMKDSKIIVAINKDEEAPIFQVADFGLVGDLFTIVPELTAALAKKGG
jgi:electron transfer flavoprotein alpha subunit